MIVPGSDSLSAVSTATMVMMFSSPKYVSTSAVVMPTTTARNSPLTYTSYRMNACCAKSSVAGSHVKSWTPPVSCAEIFAGCVGGVWSSGFAGSVVTNTGSLKGDRLPSTSRARTVKV